MANNVPSFMIASQLRKSCQLSEKTRLFVRGDENHKPNAYQECSWINFPETQWCRFLCSMLRQAILRCPQRLSSILKIFKKSSTSLITPKMRRLELLSGLEVISTQVSLLNSKGQHLCRSILGASSTTGSNIQIDMSDVFEDPEKDFKYDEDRNMLRAGISFSLLQFYDLLIKKNIFLPGGMCSHVHLGGRITLRRKVD